MTHFPPQQAQENEYDFPYHHLSYLDANGAPRICRVLPWGLNYMTWLAVVLQEIRTHSPLSVLDVGCGDGRLLGSLGCAVPRRVGVDLSERAVAFARAFYPEVDWRVGEAASVSGVFDCVSLIEVLEHIPDQDVPAFLRSVKAKVSANGHLIVSVPTRALPRNPKHFRHYTAESLASELGGDFQVRSIKYVCRLSRWSERLNWFVVNDWWIMNSRSLLSWVWAIYKRTHYWATEKDGAHMIVVARRST